MLLNKKGVLRRGVLNTAPEGVRTVARGLEVYARERDTVLYGGLMPCCCCSSCVADDEGEHCGI